MAYGNYEVKEDSILRRLGRFGQKTYDKLSDRMDDINTGKVQPVNKRPEYGFMKNLGTPKVDAAPKAPMPTSTQTTNKITGTRAADRASEALLYDGGLKRVGGSDMNMRATKVGNPLRELERASGMKPEPVATTTGNVINSVRTKKDPSVKVLDTSFIPKENIKGLATLNYTPEQLRGAELLKKIEASKEVMTPEQQATYRRLREFVPPTLGGTDRRAVGPDGRPLSSRGITSGRVGNLDVTFQDPNLSESQKLAFLKPSEYADKQISMIKPQVSERIPGTNMMRTTTGLSQMEQQNLEGTRTHQLNLLGQKQALDEADTNSQINLRNAQAKSYDATAEAAANKNNIVTLKKTDELGNSYDTFYNKETGMVYDPVDGTSKMVNQAGQQNNPFHSYAMSLPKEKRVVLYNKLKAEYPDGNVPDEAVLKALNSL